MLQTVTSTSEDVCWNIRNVKLMNFLFQNAFYCHVCHRSLCVISYWTVKRAICQYYEDVVYVTPVWSTWQGVCLKFGDECGSLCPEVQLLILLYTILAEKRPLLDNFYWNKVLISHTYLWYDSVLWIKCWERKSCCHFHVVLNK